MIEAVFISDLHLHPNDQSILKRFQEFLVWTVGRVKNIYILGDFFHVWPGDDAMNEWSGLIAQRLSALSSSGINIYFMSGNRDFLLGEKFCQVANLKMLTEPAIITLGGTRVLLVHGDRYCTKDKAHQWLRRLTRNRLFVLLFLVLPLNWRQKLVNNVRQYSQNNRKKIAEKLAVVPNVMLRHLQQKRCKTVIHGHTHVPGVNLHATGGGIYRQIVLSDWDDNPFLMCYDKSKGFYFELLSF